MAIYMIKIMAAVPRILLRIIWHMPAAGGRIRSGGSSRDTNK